MPKEENKCRPGEFPWCEGIVQGGVLADRCKRFSRFREHNGDRCTPCFGQEEVLIERTAEAIMAEEEEPVKEAITISGKTLTEKEVKLADKISS